MLLRSLLRSSQNSTLPLSDSILAAKLDTTRMDRVTMGHRAIVNFIPSAVLTALAIAFVATRICTRLRIRGKLDSSDWVIASALIFSLGFMGTLIAEATYGMGYHQADLPPETLTKQLIIFWLSIPIYNAAMVLSKTTIFLQYAQVFRMTTMLTFLKSAIAFLSIYGLWAVFSALIHCVPVSKSWHRKYEGHCLKNEILWFLNAGVYIMTDLVVIFTPILGVRGLFVKPKQKIALYVMFALGGLVLIISIVRLESILVLSTSTDFTHDMPIFSMWSSIECNVSIICACLPTLRCLLSRLWPSIVPDLDTTRSQTRPSSRALVYRTRNSPVDEIELQRLRQDSRSNSCNDHNIDELDRSRRFVPGNAFSQDIHEKGWIFKPQDSHS